MGGGGSLTLHTVKKEARGYFMVACLVVVLFVPTVLLFQNKPATSQQYFSLRTNQNQPNEHAVY
jgi:hypothetical protein